MKSKAIKFIYNFSYTLVSSLMSLIISSLVVLLIPKLIGIKEYSLWQLFLFYSNYIGFMHLGWNDGIYLRYGGKDYKQLNKNLFFSQFILLLLFQTSTAVVILVLSNTLVYDSDRLFIFNILAIDIVITNLTVMLHFILRATYRIKSSALIGIIEKLTYVVFIVTFLFFGYRNYRFLIIANLIGKLFALIFAIIQCKEIVLNKLSSFKFNISETISNISVGIKLMFANIASILIIGVVRFGIERTWDLTTFGKVSLTLSASNLVLLFINALGLVIFPILRRTDQLKLPKIYSLMQNLLMMLLIGLLIIYYPFKTILTSWLPEYSESLKYMALLFPSVIFEGKMSLLINTYFKALRKEKSLLVVNLITLVLSILSTICFTLLFKNLTLLIGSIVFVLAFRVILSEWILAKALNLAIVKEILLEIGLTVIFIFSGWFINSWSSFFIYSLAFIFYLLIKKKDLKETFKYAKMIFVKKSNSLL